VPRSFVRCELEDERPWRVEKLRDLRVDDGDDDGSLADGNKVEVVDALGRIEGVDARKLVVVRVTNGERSESSKERPSPLLLRLRRGSNREPSGSDILLLLRRPTIDLPQSLPSDLVSTLLLQLGRDEGVERSESLGEMTMVRSRFAESVLLSDGEVSEGSKVEGCRRLPFHRKEAFRLVAIRIESEGDHARDVTDEVEDVSAKGEEGKGQRRRRRR